MYICVYVYLYMYINTDKHVHKYEYLSDEMNGNKPSAKTSFSNSSFLTADQYLAKK